MPARVGVEARSCSRTVVAADPNAPRREPASVSLPSRPAGSPRPRSRTAREAWLPPCVPARTAPPQLEAVCSRIRRGGVVSSLGVCVSFAGTQGAVVWRRGWESSRASCLRAYSGQRARRPPCRAATA
jgi:hypothetical protein